MKKLLIISVILILGIISVSAQSCFPSGIIFYNQAVIDGFQTNYPNCTEIVGGVLICGDDITNLNGLSVITSIGGDLKIGSSYVGNPALTSLAGLDNIASIGGDLSIDGNDALTSLAGLENLTTIGGSLEIYNNNALTSLTGLENLTSIGGGLFLGLYYGNDALTSLTGLDNLTSIGEDLYIWGNDTLTSLTGLDNLTSIGGDLTILENNALTSLTGLDNLTSIGEDLLIDYNEALTSLTGLDNLISIEGDLDIKYNDALTSLTGLENLTSIGGDLSITYVALTSLSGLDNVTSVGGDLNIGSNYALKSLSGLDKIEAESIANLWIENNPNLSHCSVLSICDYLVAPNGTIEIHDNATSCDSPDEVQDSCIANGVNINEQYIKDNLVIYPNPSSTQITIELPATPQKNTSLSIYNLNGQQLTTQRITEPQTVVDISGWPKGVYFVKVVDDENVMVQKVIKQ